MKRWGENKNYIQWRKNYNKESEENDTNKKIKFQNEECIQWANKQTGNRGRNDP